MSPLHEAAYLRLAAVWRRLDGLALRAARRMPAVRIAPHLKRR